MTYSARYHIANDGNGLYRIQDAKTDGPAELNDKPMTQLSYSEALENLEELNCQPS
jgi:hypothetical protein